MEFLTIGVTNRSGLRNKEQLAAEQGSGIWSYSETQLSSVTQKTAAKALKFHAANCWKTSEGPLWRPSNLAGQIHLGWNMDWSGLYK